MVKRLLLLALIAAFGVALAGASANTYKGRYSKVRGSYSAVVKVGDSWTDVNTSTLGQDLIAGEYWTPTVDFSGGTKYYFDPDATVKGDGSLDSPFRSLAVEVASDSTIERCDADDYVVDNAANGPVVGPGDVCVLLGGSHGKINLKGYYFSDYLGIVGVSPRQAEVDYIKFADGERLYVSNLKWRKFPRYEWDSPGDMADTGYDDMPARFIASRDTNGNGVANYIIIEDCDLSGGTAAEALAWSETEWDSTVATAIFLSRVDYAHVQDCVAVGVNYFIQAAGTVAADAKRVQIVRNTASHMAGDGIQLGYVDSVYVARNYLHDWHVVNDNHVDYMQWWQQSDNVIVERNKFFETTGDRDRPPLYLAGIYSSATNVLADAVIQNNIIYHGDYNAIRINGGENVSVLNNTIVGRSLKPDSTNAVVAWVQVTDAGTSSGCVVANNIGGNVQGTAVTGVSTSSNLSYFRDFSTVGFASFTQDGDPTLWDLRLSATSPAIRAGSSTYAPDADYAGASRPDRVFDDVGAYVYDDPDVTAPAQITAALDYRNASSLQISWVDPVATDAWYCTVYRGTASGSLDSVAVASMGDEVYYDDTIDSGTDYYFAVTCTDSSGNESAQRELSAPADATAPTAVSDLLVTNYFDQVDLTWTDPADADLDYINLYRDQTDGSTLFDVVAKGTETYSDTTVNTDGDSTYYYRVAGVDSSGNVATLSNTESATPEASLVITAADSLYDEANELASVDFTTNVARMLSFRHQVDGGAWSSATTLDTAVTAATHYVDTSGETDGAEIGIMAYYAGEDTATATVTINRGSPPDTTGVLAAPAIAWGDTSNTNAHIVATVDASASDEALMAFSQVKVSHDGTWTPADTTGNWWPATATTASFTDTVYSGQTMETIAGDTLYWRTKLRDMEATPNESAYIDIANPIATVLARAADTTPPDTTGVFAGVVVDTTGADILLTLSDMTITGDPSQVQFEWSNDGGSNYYGDSSWSPGTASTTVGDTIHTTLTDPGDMNGDLYTRFRLRDDEGTPNVSGWNVNAQAFSRASSAASDTVGYGTEANWYRDATTYAYASRIVMPAAGSVTSATWWMLNDSDPFDIKVALYDDSNNLLASGELTNVTAANGGEWITVDFDVPYSASSSELLWVSCFTSSASLTANYYDDISWPVIASWSYTPASYAAYPADPATRASTYQVRRFSAYITYTP